jgi:hypothetical protein
MLAQDEVIIHETTPNQVFAYNFTIFIQIHHIVVAFYKDNILHLLSHV